jgi:two-component system sensor histidine kinase PilS (NtrC family)
MATPQGSLTVTRVLGSPTLPAARPGEEAAGGTGGGPPGRAAGADTFARRAMWLVALRPVLLTVVIGTALLIDLPESISLLSREFGGFLLAVTYVLTGAYLLSRGLIHRFPWFVEAQLLVDVAMISMIVLLTGGLESHFVPLYMLPILGGGVTRLTRGGLAIACVSALVFGMLVASQFGLVVPQPQEWGLTVPSVLLPSPRFAFYSVALTAAGFLAAGRLTGFLAESLHSADIRLERASNSLADLQAYNQHVIDSMTGGLAATDVHGRVLMVNRAAEAITGEIATQVLGRSVAEVLQLPGELRRSLAEIVGPGRNQRTEYRYLRRSGQSIDVGLSVGPLVGKKGQLGYLFTFQDLTDYKRQEREEQKQKRLAAIGEMAAGIAHEIRNPLASMSGSMQLLRQELKLTTEQAQLFDIVARESDRLNDTIRDFLAYARPSQPRVARVDVRLVLKEAAQLIRNNPECRSSHRVDLQVPETEVTCEADEAQIRQILWNLATNGIRAMPKGGMLTLSTRASGPADAPAGIVISVRDDGVGMAPEALDRIFQPFHGGFAKGSGLGLAIVHRIVSDRGGEIRVSSQVGKGTTVDVHWPTQAQPQVSARTTVRGEMALAGGSISSRPDRPGHGLTS